MANYFNLEIDNLWALNMPAVPVGATFSRVPSYFIPELLANQVSPADLATYNAFLATLIPLGAPYTSMADAFADMPAQAVSFSGNTVDCNNVLAALSLPPQTGLNNAANQLALATDAIALAFNTSNVGLFYTPAVTFATLGPQAANMALQNNDVRKAGNDIVDAINTGPNATTFLELAANLATAQIVVDSTVTAAVDLRTITLGGPSPANLVTSTTAIETATDQVTKFLDYIAGLAAPTNIVGPGVAYPNFAAFLVAQGVPL